MWNFLKSLWYALTGKVDKLDEVIENEISETREELSEKVDDVKEVIKDVIEDIKDDVQDLVEIELRPTMKNKKDEIISFMVDRDITYNSKDSKKTLLEKIEKHLK